MFFSFVMCVHQEQPFIEKSIISMIDQDYNYDYEVIIIANGCTDELYIKLEKYCESFEKIRLFRTSIGQLAFNLNYGIDKANGEYIIRMDADDVCFPDRLKNTKEYLALHYYPDVLAGLAQEINEKDEVIDSRELHEYPDNVKFQFWRRNSIVHPATAIKRSALIKVRGYLGGINCEDYDLWLRMDRLKMKFSRAKFFAIQYRSNSYQVKGSRIAYADATGLRLREALYRGSFLYFAATFYRTLGFYWLAFRNKMH